MIRRIFSLVVAALLLAGCAGLGGPRTITLTEADLAQRLEREFPLERRMLEILDVRIDTPRVTLLPERNRIATELSLAAAERLSGRRYGGRLAIDYGLRYDERAQAILLSDVRVQRLQFDGLGAGAPPILERIGALLAEQMLQDTPIYRVREQDLKTAQGLGLQPSAVAVTARGVEITLSPVR